MISLQINEKTVKAIYQHFIKALPGWKLSIERRFLSNEMKEKYMDLLIGKFVNVQIVGNWKLVLMNTFTKANMKNNNDT